MFVAMLFLNFDGALVGFETRALVPKRRDLAWPPHTDLPILPSSVRSPRAVPLCALWSPPPGDFHGQHQVLCVSVLAVRVLFGSQRYIGKWLRAYQHFVWVRSFFAVFVHDDEPCAGRRPQPRVCTLCFVRQLGSDAEFFSGVSHRSFLPTGLFFFSHRPFFFSHRPFLLFPLAFFFLPPAFFLRPAGSKTLECLAQMPSATARCYESRQRATFRCLKATSVPSSYSKFS